MADKNNNRGDDELGVEATIQDTTTTKDTVPKRRATTTRASVTAYVQSLKPFALTFQDVSVYVPREKGCCSSSVISKCFCLCNPLSSFMTEQLGWAVEKTDPYYALTECSGYVHTGQKVLVLSPDSQFSSALIQALTGRLSDKYSVGGNIRVNHKPIPTQLMQGWRRIAAHVSSDDGTHSPVLTVRETLRFAAECTRSEQETPDNIDDVVNEVLETLDLTGAADTVVGDDNLRGISGGQKRRVTVGEMLVAKGTRFLGLENITDGLSSQDSFNIVRQLKTACKSFQSAAVISLNQPSDEIVELFDNILVLDNNGQLAYFGPPSSSRETLCGIFVGQDATASSKTGSICDLCLNPMTKEGAADDIRARFMQSSLYQELDHNLRYHDKAWGTVDVTELLPSTKYASGMLHMFKVLGKRKRMLIVRNPSTYLRVVVAVFFGVVIGSLFSVLGQDLGSSLARTAYLFQNLFLVLLLSTGVTVPQNIRDRITYFKHRSSEFYSSKVYYVCQILFELPLSIVEAILLSVSSYWWVHLNPIPARFFFFLGVMITMEFVGLALGRLFCAVSRTQVVAKSVISVATLLFSTVSGFMPKYGQIPVILRWLSWFSPPAYAFEALAINEYVGRELSVATISRGDSLDTQVGSLSGEQWLGILQLPRVAWTSYQGIKIFDIIMLFILAIVIDIVGLTLMERSRRMFFGQLRRPQRSSKSLNFVSEDGKGREPDPPQWPTSLTVSNLCYHVPLKRESAPLRCSPEAIFGPLLLGGKKGTAEVAKTKETPELQLLDNVSATFLEGRATALMGTSGAGKTTLLDVIAGYKTGGRITGNITLNGLPKDKQIWQLFSGYAEQNDILNPYLTVLETLKFTACCRLPASMNRGAIIEKMVRLMNLEDWLDIVIGVENEGEGIPKHARKRLTIAVQLVMLPKILFLDEPTTGLGTSAANLVTNAIRRSTTELNLITVATIHQPSKLIWDSFDDLLLLAKGGKVAYMGEMGSESQTVIDYFSGLSGTTMPANANPADFVISSVSGVNAEVAQTRFQTSKNCEMLMSRLKEENDLSETEKAAAVELMSKTKREVGKHKSFFRELWILTKRQLITQWRNPAYSMTRIICCTLLSVYFGVLFIADKSTIEGAVLTIGATFFLVFVLVVPMQAAVVPLIADRAVLYREATSGLYGRLSYAISSLLADLPFHALNCLLMFLAFYFLVGFQIEGDRPAYFIAMMFLVNWAFTSIGQLYAVVTPNEEAANGLAGLTVILSVLFMGFLIQVDNMPFYWKWAYTADLLRYVIQGQCTNELSDNYYLLFPPGTEPQPNVTLFGELGNNATNLFLFPSGTDVSPGSSASQAATLMNLFINGKSENEDAPPRKITWNNTFIGALQDFIDCGMQNECFVDPVASNFMSCFVFRLRGDPPCKNEFDAAIDSVGNARDTVSECRSNTAGGQRNSSSAIITTAVDGDEGSGVLSNTNDDADDDQQVTVRCLVNAMVPAGGLDEVKTTIESTVETLQNIAMVAVSVIDTLEKGLPGEVILFVFGWAIFQDGELVAPYKWWYCLFAVSMFIVGIELIKIFATRFIVWTKR